MGFKKLPGNRGLLYEPESKPGINKNCCVDCYSCQWCSNERCRVCLDENEKKVDIMCENKKPNPKEFLNNFSKPIPVKKKLSLLLKNNMFKLMHLKKCCGHPGEPGC